MEWLVAVEVLAILALLPFVFFAMAKKNWMFTLLESGNIKYIYRGDTLLRIIADIRGKRITPNYTLVAGTETRTWWEKRFGIFLVGIPPFASVKKFQIKRRKEHEELAGKATTEWIRDLGEVEIDSLRGMFPRPFLLTEVELGDRQTVNLLVVGKFAVVNAYTPIVELKGEFFELTGSILRGAVVDVLHQCGTMDKFLAVNKGEEGILAKLVSSDSATPSRFNQILGERVGLHLVGATIPQWDPSDLEVRKSMNAQFIAEKTREVEIVAADAYAKQLGVRAQADASAVTIKAAARGEHVRKTLEAIAAKGGNPDELVRAAAGILRAESLPNLTTLVDGGGTTPVVAVGGDRK